MSVLAMTCPHCGVQNVAFNAVMEHRGDAPIPTLVLFRCSRCGHGVMAETLMLSEFVKGTGSFNQKAPDARIFPKPEMLCPPEHVPDNARDLFSEGVSTLTKETRNASCMAFRACLEAALKTMDSEMGGWVSLKERIDRLASRHLLPPAIRDWAHQIRIMGNESAHGDGSATLEDAQELHGFVRYTLLYLFTLPQEIELARERRKT